MTRQLDGFTPSLLATSRKLKQEKNTIYKANTREYHVKHLNKKDLYTQSYISGFGFPAVTSSPPTMVKKDSFQPIVCK